MFQMAEVWKAENMAESLKQHVTYLYEASSSLQLDKHSSTHGGSTCLLPNTKVGTLFFFQP